MTLKKEFGVTNDRQTRKTECPTEEYSNFCRLVFEGCYRFPLLFRKILSSSERHLQQ